mmetsp:Transcript_24906/g.28446  ORF Transcript_24906/g.28446 Transcript_24906/m.28446 type:complete len:89 (+) Transcript_24906:328-594(+)
MSRAGVSHLEFSIGESQTKKVKVESLAAESAMQSHVWMLFCVPFLVFRIFPNTEPLFHSEEVKQKEEEEIKRVSTHLSPFSVCYVGLP